MSRELLVMRYHPAKKEVEFQRFNGEKEVLIAPDSRLRLYMNQRGKFVLQDHGNPFFDDIALAFDGEKVVNMKVVTTKLDYEDFVQMVDYYNAQSRSCQIELASFIELPDMGAAYLAAKKCGEDATSILNRQCQKLYAEVDQRKEAVKQKTDDFVSKISEGVQNVRKKIDSLSDDRVSLCFAGGYSSGKSTLINAILGYRILPESINSETAKMMKISSPREGEPVKISFQIHDQFSEIEWNPSTRCFEFSKGPSESAVRREIQNVMNSASGKRKDEQIYKILDHLNKCSDNAISSEITVLFPVPLDNEKVQFVIFDTPGTDSNSEEHKRVLEEALQNQTQSILIFVVKPDGLEGSANDALLELLTEVEKKDSKTSIDLGRSLFVINKADTVPADSRKSLGKQTIKSKNNDNLSISLSDKKVFFVSALYGYAANAMKNEVANENDKGVFQAGKSTLENETFPMSFCYRQNRCATSERATESIIEKSDRAFAGARDRGDEFTTLSVSSGMYALEKEIVEYGEKYAVAVKAYAIIDSIDRILNKLSGEVKSLRASSQDDVATLERNIEEVENTLNSAINSVHQSMRLPNPVPRNVREDLNLGRDSMYSSIVEPVEQEINDKLKGRIFNRAKVKVKDEDKKSMIDFINTVETNFTKSFCSARESLLERQRDLFMKKVKQAIADNGKISDSAHKYFLEIPSPSITDLGLAKSTAKLYDACRHIHQGFFRRIEYLDKEELLDGVGKHLVESSEKMYRAYIEEYRDALDSLLQKITTHFRTHFDEYSLAVKSLKEDRDAMARLCDGIGATGNSLEKCLGKFNQIVWKEQ